MVIKVISLNLWWGGHLFPAIIDFLKVEKADIIMLQEVNNAQGNNLKDSQRSMEILGQRLKYPHAEYAKSFILDEPEGKIPYGNAVLSAFPIAAKDSRYLFEPIREKYQDVAEQWPIFPRLLQHVEVSTPTGVLDVFNMHGVWDLNGNSVSEDRRKMFAILNYEIKGKPNVLLGGDSNANSTNPLWKTIDQQLNSVFGHELKTTFNMRHKDNPGYASAAVDVMYVSPNIEILSKDCPDVDISDHLPLIATLKI